MPRTLKAPDFKDLDLRYQGHPMYVEPAIIQGDIIQVIVQNSITQFIGFFDSQMSQTLYSLFHIPRAFFAQIVHNV